MNNKFPRANSKYGRYCAAKLKAGQKPPKNSLHGSNSSLTAITGKQEQFYEFKGKLLAKSVRFVSKSPWLLPFCINALSVESIMNLTMTVEVFQKQYVLAGFTLHHPGHYTAGIAWRGEKYFYDGLNHCS